jgi:hypothetical protein
MPLSPRGEKLRSAVWLGVGLAAAIVPALALAQSAAPGEPSGSQAAPPLPSFLDDRRLREIEAARRAAEEAARQKQESDARRKAEDDRRLAAEAEAKRKAEEIRRAITGEAAGKRHDAGKGAGDGDEAEARLREERRQAAEAEARRKEEEEKRQAAEAEARRKAEEEKRQAAEAEARRKAEEEKRQAAEAEARRKVEEEQRRRAAEAEAKRKTEPAPPHAPARAAVAAPPKITPAGTPCPAAKLTATPLPGGRAELAIESECRAGQVLTLSYGSFSLPAEFDAGGRYEATFDLFLGKDAPLEAVFADKTRARIAVQGLDFDRISKIAIVWRAPVNLDLHALEYTARHGGAGHVWAKSPSSADAALEQSRKTARGRGFLSAAADGTAEGDKVEVYTFWHADGQESGAVSLMVDYETRGEVPLAEACGSGSLASIEFRVLRLARGAAAAVTEQRALAAAPCGKPLPAEARFNPDSMPHLMIRR